MRPTETKVTFNVKMDVKGKTGDRLSDVLVESDIVFLRGVINLIKADTGTGKTDFVINKLATQAKSEGEKVVVLVNRNLLKKQLLQRIFELKIMSGEETNVSVFTYQEIENDGKAASEKKREIRDSRYIVCDECHYFWSDSLFNPGTQHSFDFLVSLYSDHAVTFMSATPERIKTLIEVKTFELYLEKCTEVEANKRHYEEIVNERVFYKKNGEERDIQAVIKKRERIENSEDYREMMQEFEKEMIPPVLNEYKMSIDNSAHMEIKVLCNIETLVNSIESSGKNDRWIVFVDSKKIGKKLKRELKTRNIRTVYVDADYDEVINDTRLYDKTKKEMNRIVTEGKMRSKVLITTAILNNGVSFMQKAVKNIVIMTDDREDFIQMIGRKRFLGEEDNVTIYIWRKKQNNYKKRMRQMRRTFEWLDNHKRISVCKFNLTNQKYPSQPFNMISSYYECRDLEYEIQPITQERIRYQYLFYKHISEGLENDPTYEIREKLGWIGIEFQENMLDGMNLEYSEHHIQSFSMKLKNYYAKGIIDKCGLEQLSQDLLQLAIKISLNEFSDTKYSPNKLSDKRGSIGMVNKALRLRNEWKDYAVQSVGDDKTYYEIMHGKECQYQVDSSLTYDEIKKKLEDINTQDIKEVFRIFFELDLPECLEKDPQSTVSIMNCKLKEQENLKNYIIKTNTQKKYFLTTRPNTKTNHSKE